MALFHQALQNSRKHHRPARRCPQHRPAIAAIVAAQVNDPFVNTLFIQACYQLLKAVCNPGANGRIGSSYQGTVI